MKGAVVSGNTLQTPGEAYRTGFRDGVLCAVGAVGTIVMLMVLAGCDDGERFHRIAEVERATRIANACTPYADERRVVEWAIVDHEPVLTVTVQRFAGRTPNAVQYVVLSATEIR